MNTYDQLMEWGKADGIDMSYVTYDREDLGKKILGITRFKWVENHKGADIRISYDLTAYPLMTYTVAWHEYNHFAEWVLYGSTGHGSKWFKLYWRKPLLVLLDCTYVNIKWMLIKHKKP